MTTPFDRRILWVHWQGNVVSERTIGEMAQAIRRDTPNVAGVAVKSSNGAAWQGDLGDKPTMAVTGADAIRRWVDELGAHGLETHLWCVVRGGDIPREAQLVIEACRVPGVKSMLLDVEGGAAYFGGKTAADARNLITRIRAGIAPDFHLALNFDARGSHPASIHIQEWLPHVQSLHPMVYHWEFGGGRNGPEGYLDDAFGVLAHYGLPIVPMLQTYPNPTDPPRPVPEEEVYIAGEYSFTKGAVGITLFRYGGESSAAQIRAGVARIDPLRQRPAPQPTTRVFRVTAQSLRVRSQPGTQNTATVTLLPAGTRVEADAQSRTEADSYVWWKIEQGWAAQGRADNKQTLMVEVTPGVPPYGLVTLAEQEEPTLPDGPDVPQKRFRVVTSSLLVRSEPELASQYVLPVGLTRGDEITVDADAWVEKNGYVWWNHGAGWSAEYATASGLRLMEDLTPEIPRKIPLPTENPDGDPPPTPGPTPEPPTIPNKLFRVVADPLNVRSAPALSGSFVTSLRRGAELLVQADDWREKDGYVWWQHGQGWSAERTLDGRTVYLQDLTPDIPRVDPDAQPAPEPPPQTIPNKRFRVVGSTLNVRKTPSLSGTYVTALSGGAELVARADGWREADGHVWWQHERGWSAERTLDGRTVYLRDLTPDIPRVDPDAPSTPTPTPAPTPTPVEQFEPIPPGFARFQVVALGLKVRAEPRSNAQQVGTLQQGAWLEIDTTQGGVRAEADGFVWWRHGQGWSAERSLDGRSVFMLNIGALPMLGTLLTRLPVRIEDTDWVQYYGNTSFAYRNGRANSYHQFAQGLHSGLDFGKFTSRRDDPPVFAGVHGLFDGRGAKYGPNRVDVLVGDYRLIYGHIGKPVNLPRRAPIVPDTVMGTVEFSQIHLHFEVRYKDTYIINPLLLMPPSLVEQFIGKFPPKPTEFVETGNWKSWLSPFDQPIIRLGGEVIGPTA